MKKIDIETWARKDIYLFYKDFDRPQYIMTFDLDMTHFCHKVKSLQISFYLSFMFVAMKELNQIENFRYRFINHEPVLLDISHPSFTDRIEGTDTFKIVTVEMQSDLNDFLIHAKAVSDEQGSQFLNIQKEARNDLVYISTFPWATFTQVSHAYNINPYDAIPRLIWGKYRQVGDQLIMPFSIEVHHAFADGMHVGKYIQNLQLQLNQF